MQLTLANIKQDPQVDEFNRLTDEKLDAMNYTDHGRRHAKIVADRAQMIAKNVGLGDNEIEYAGIAGFCHDMGNFFDRKLHHYWAGMFFHQIFTSQIEDVDGIAAIIQAIANHDKDEARLTNTISAVLIIADKSDVHKDRVKDKNKDRILDDIHKRVNYSIVKNDLDVHEGAKMITLMLKLDTDFTPVMDYFEIFLHRMNYCRKSAEYLGYKFKLVINDFELL